MASHGHRAGTGRAIHAAGASDSGHRTPDSTPRLTFGGFHDFAGRVIPTSDPAALAETILGSESQKTMAHGRAGIGKTTTMQALESHLPEGSAVITYDCFGGGDYLSPGEERHTPRRALVQIVNEICLRVGTEPLLLSTNASEADLWLRFRQRLADAAQTFARGLVLIVAIDAADNATFAASRRGETSFVGDLWALPLPENVRLLMTCRTHRRDEISPPGDIPQYALAGFDRHASTSMLQARFPDATTDDGQRFHDRTQGIPRIQAYVLEADGSDTLETVLARSEKGLDEVFEDVLRAALEERTDPVAARNDLATLFVMARPVDLNSFARALSVTRSVAAGGVPLRGVNEGV